MRIPNYYWLIVPRAPTVKTIVVTPANPTINQNTTEQFIATATYSDGSTADVTALATWTSDNHAVATVNGSGLASGVGGGHCTIAATYMLVSGNTGLTVNAAFDLTTLNTSARFASNGSLLRFPSPSNGTNGDIYWIGTATAGASGNTDAWLPVDNLTAITGLPLNGFATLNLRAPSGIAARFLNMGLATADGRTGSPNALAAGYANHITAGLLTLATGSVWALINPRSAAGGGFPGVDDGVVGPFRTACLQLGAGQAEGVSGFNNGFAFGAVTLNTWQLLQLRYSGGIMECRINQGAWVTSPGSSGAGTTVGIGQACSSGLAMNGCLADCAMSTTRYDDATFDNIYNGLKALYPGAGLP